MTPLNTSWLTVRAYTSGALDPFILEAVPPALDLARAQAHRLYFTRHWACGPHLCLHVAAERRAEGSPPLVAALQAQLQRALQEPPVPAASAPPPTEALYAALADREQYPGPYWPLQAHGTVEVTARQRTFGLRNAEPLEHLIDDVQVAMNDVMLLSLRDVSQGRSLLHLCLEFMVGTLDRTAHDTTIDNGFLSYRSHAEIFLVNVDDSVRHGFDAQYRVRGAEVRRQVMQWLSGDSACPHLMAPWRAHLGHLHRQAWATLETGAVDLSWKGQDFSLRHEHMRDAITRSGRSDFHRTELANLENLERRSQDVSFNAFRVLLNAQYLQLTRLGLSPVRRALLCHLIASAVEDLFGLDAVQLASRYSYLQTTPA